MRVRLLGTGTSHGIPVIGCPCSVCTSGAPYNQRTRSSLLFESGTPPVGGPASDRPEAGRPASDGAVRRVVVDTTPEFRLQALAAGLTTLDAVLLTHPHADHIFGLDDVRIFNARTKRSLPIFGSTATLDTVRRRFSYAFEAGQEGGGKPRLELLAVDGPFEVAGFDVEPLTVRHGSMDVTAFRVQQRPGGPAFAYATDCNAIPPATMAALGGLDLLILDALGKNRHPTHFSLDEAIAVARELAPRRTLFTHISHSLDHETTNAALPPDMALAYDGQVIEL